METGIIHQEPMILHLQYLLQVLQLAQVPMKEITGVLVGVQDLILVEVHQYLLYVVSVQKKDVLQSLIQLETYYSILMAH